jgi:uncharacterized membrane protein
LTLARRRHHASSVQPPPEPPEHQSPSALAGIVRRNIHALLEARAAFDRDKSREARIADGIAYFTGSIRFVYLHAAIYGAWIVVNIGVVPWIRPFDPFPFVMLAMVASVEAIFLSTFVLISQNRMQALADRRADLDVQISLLAEHEITKIIRMLDCISDRLGVRDPCAVSEDLEELKRDVAPEQVLEEIGRAEKDEPPRKH